MLYTLLTDQITVNISSGNNRHTPHFFVSYYTLGHQVYPVVDFSIYWTAQTQPWVGQTKENGPQILPVARLPTSETKYL